MDSTRVITSISRSLELTAKSKSDLETLAYLFSNYAITTGTMRTFSAKISSLEYFLQNVQALLEKLGLRKAEDLAPIEDVIQNLEERLEACQRDIGKWIERITNMNLDSGRILTAFNKTARIALLTDDFVQIGQQATDHQHGMAADLQILFSWIASIKSNQHPLPEQQAPDIEPGSDVISNETTLGTDYEEEGSQILKLVYKPVDSPASPPHPPPPSTEEVLGDCDCDCGTPPVILWSCDAISGIDDAFLDYDQHSVCIYCFAVFPTVQFSADWRTRGMHLVQEHSFGLCNLTKEFDSWKDMENHLVEFHKLDKEYSNVIFTNFERRTQRPRSLYRIFEDTEPDERIPDDSPDPAHRISAQVKFILEHLQYSGLREILANPECRDHSVLAKLWNLDGDLAGIEEGIIIDSNIDLLASRDIFIDGLIKSAWIQERLSLESQDLNFRVENLQAGRRDASRVMPDRRIVGDWLLETLSQSLPMQRILRGVLARLNGGVVDTDVGAVLERLLVYRFDDEDLRGDELPAPVIVN